MADKYQSLVKVDSTFASACCALHVDHSVTAFRMIIRSIFEKMSEVCDATVAPIKNERAQFKQEIADLKKEKEEHERKIMDQAEKIKEFERLLKP